MDSKDKISLNTQISSAAVRAEQSEAEFKLKQAQIDEATSILASFAANAMPQIPESPPQGATKSPRNIQVSVRFTPKEHQLLQKRIDASGLPQGEYIRSMALSGKVISRKIPDCDDFLMDEIASLRSITGRLGGLLKMIRNACEGQSTINESFITWLREASLAMQSYKQHLQAIEVKLNGNN